MAGNICPFNMLINKVVFNQVRPRKQCFNATFVAKHSLTGCRLPHTYVEALYSRRSNRFFLLFSCLVPKSTHNNWRRVQLETTNLHLIIVDFNCFTTVADQFIFVVLY